MPRVARIVIPGVPHHVTQRGNNRQDVFFVDDDYRVYLELLCRLAELNRVEIHGYCLMANHVHLIATPASEHALAATVGRTRFRYSQYVNRLHACSGHLWQGRFHSTALDQEHFWWALRYVERNPVRARVVRRAWRYRWSSAAAHVGETRSDELIDLRAWRRRSARLDWRALLCEPEDELAVHRLRSHTHTGRPLGSDSFVAKLERRLGRRLRPLPVGRPRKKPAERKL
ncbi:MAG: transposase [Planctomycetes bacterium]|nr:transposase [Planctomycetota bacterium]